MMRCIDAHIRIYVPLLSLFTSLPSQRISMLKEHWCHLRSLENVPPITAYTFMGHLYQVCTEIDVIKSRCMRRAAFYTVIRDKIKNFAWKIQRARATGNEDDIYHVKHMNNKYHNYVSERCCWTRAGELSTARSARIMPRYATDALAFLCSLPLSSPLPPLRSAPLRLEREWYNRAYPELRSGAYQAASEV
jgi:hypothetical protein